MNPVLLFNNISKALPVFKPVYDYRIQTSRWVDLMEASSAKVRKDLHKLLKSKGAITSPDRARLCGKISHQLRVDIRIVQDLLSEHGIDVSPNTVGMWSAKLAQKTRWETPFTHRARWAL
jgi:hypothetical protein